MFHLRKIGVIAKESCLQVLCCLFSKMLSPFIWEGMHKLLEAWALQLEISSTFSSNFSPCKEGIYYFPYRKHKNKQIRKNSIRNPEIQTKQTPNELVES